MERRLPQFFFALSLIVLVLMLGAVWQAGSPTWKTYQQEFHRLEAVGEPNAAAKSDVLNASLVIHQDLLPGLQRVDRCTTCHLGVEDPTMKNARQPFTLGARASRPTSRTRMARWSSGRSRCCPRNISAPPAGDVIRRARSPAYRN
jgi:DNA-binding helix-hairpin-helix protein with protein kinase domain